MTAQEQAGRHPRRCRGTGRLQGGRAECRARDTAQLC